MSQEMSNWKLNAPPKLMIFPPTIEYFQEYVKRSHLQAATEWSVFLSEPLDFNAIYYG